jgi:hypothetical protein
MNLLRRSSAQTGGSCHGSSIHSLLCFLFPYSRIHFPYLTVLFNPCALWLLVAWLMRAAVHLAASHMHYIQGFVSGCAAALAWNVLGGSRLASVSLLRVKGLGPASLASRRGRRNCVYKRTCPPTVLFPFLFSLHSYLFILPNKYLEPLRPRPGPCPRLRLCLCFSLHRPCLCRPRSVLLLLSSGLSLAPKHGLSSVAARHSFRDPTLEFPESTRHSSRVLITSLEPPGSLPNTLPTTAVTT